MNIKTISAMLLATSSAWALIGPGAQHKTICLDAHIDKDGIISSGSCDQSENNKTLKKDIQSNGCAEDQASVVATRHKGQKEYNIKVPTCLPPNVVQL